MAPRPIIRPRLPVRSSSARACGRRVDVAVGDDGTRHRRDRLANQVVVHGRPVHLRHRARVHGEHVERVPREDRQQRVELLRRGETEARLHGERDRHRLAQRAEDGVDARALAQQAAAGALAVDDRRGAAQVQVDGRDRQLLQRRRRAHQRRARRCRSAARRPAVRSCSGRSSRRSTSPASSRRGRGSTPSSRRRRRHSGGSATRTARR